MYTYAWNNPLAYVDPTGLEVDKIGGCLYNVTHDPETGAETIINSIGCDQPGGGTNSSSDQKASSAPTRNPEVPKNMFSCASEFAAKYSIAGALQRFGIGTSGAGGFITNALGGNALSGATDLVQSIGSGEGGGHDVLYNFGQGLAAGPTQGFGAAFGKSIEGTPWAAGPVDVVTTALVSKGFALATGAGQSLQTLNGAVKLGSIGLEAAEFATGFGEAKLAYDVASYAVGLAACAAKKH